MMTDTQIERSRERLLAAYERLAAREGGVEWARSKPIEAADWLGLEGIERLAFIWSWRAANEQAQARHLFWLH